MSSIIPRGIILKIVLIIAFQAFAPLVQAQDKSVTINAKEITVQEAFASLEKQTGFTIAYAQSKIDVAEKINVSLENVSLEAALEQILNVFDVGYTIRGYHVIIYSPKNKYTQIAEAATPEIVQEPAPQPKQLTNRVVGVVRDRQTGFPIAGAFVSLLDHSGFQAISDNEGRFAFNKVSLGVKMLKVVLKGVEEPVYQSVDVLPGGEVMVSVITSSPVVVEPKVIIPQEEKFSNILKDNRLLYAKRTIEPIVPVRKRTIPHVIEWKPMPSRSFAIKSNVLYGMTATINLGVEFAVSDRFTVDVPVSYNPWEFGDTFKFKHILIQPEFRYWIYEPFNKHFLGVHLQYAHFNMEGVKPVISSDKRFQGDLYGLGVSYGYTLFLAPCWSMEMTLGFGYAYMDYIYQDCTGCSGGKGITNAYKHYVGPTKAGLSLIYLIK